MRYVLSLLSLCVFLSSSCVEQEGVKRAAKKEGFQVILITDVGGLGDKGFNDAGWQGCEDAKLQLAKQGVAIETDVIESREQTDYIDNLNFAAERANVVVALGFLIADAVEEVAKHYPDTHFVFIDGEIKGDNIASFVFRSQEGGFLAGILSAYVTNTGVVAVMPGMDIPPVEAFASGYRAGALTGSMLLAKEINALSSTIGSFNDPVKAKSIAQSLINQDVDILFQLAGNSGLGVLEAVKEASGKRYMIGVDINQDDLAPGKVLTSVLKRMDLVVTDQIIAAYNGELKSGVFNVGLKEDYMGLTEMKYTRDLVPSAAFKTIEKAKQLIIDGAITIPDTYEKLSSFKHPVQELKN